MSLGVFVHDKIYTVSSSTLFKSLNESKQTVVGRRDWWSVSVCRTEVSQQY